MFSSEREQLILEYLSEHGLVSTAFLCELTGASIATVRRDLNSLKDKGLIIKTHGGAEKLPSPPAAQHPSILDTPDVHYAEKERLAQKAATLIQPNDIIFIGAGKTCALLARYVKHVEKLIVVTSNINAVVELSDADNVSIILLGGDVHVGSNHIETLGEFSLGELHKLFFNKVFFTVDGVDLEYGYSIINRSQLPLYHYLLGNSKDCYVLIDYTKFNKRTFTQLCGLDTIANVITNQQADGNYIRYYQEHHVAIYFGK